MWANRDRFVLSAGHASTLLYALLHLAGVKSVNPDYETVGDAGRRARRPQAVPPARLQVPRAPGVPVDLRGGVHHRPARHRHRDQRRAWRSPGVWQAATFNRPGFDLFDYDVYAICGDGCLMEGIGAEAASLAGHLKLSNLCWIYDNNKITIEGATEPGVQRGRAGPVRRATAGRCSTSTDANDLDALSAAIEAFKAETDRPTLIVVDSVIGYGAPNKQGTHAAHGEPLGADEVARHQALLRLARGRDRSSSPTGSRSTSPARWHENGGAAAPRVGGAVRRATPPSTPTWPSSSTTCSAGTLPDGLGRRPAGRSRPTRRASPAATPAARCSTRSRGGCRG